MRPYFDLRKVTKSGADRAAKDFKHEVVNVPADRHVTVHMAPGGGWAARITR